MGLGPSNLSHAAPSKEPAGSTPRSGHEKASTVSTSYSSARARSSSEPTGLTQTSGDKKAFTVTTSYSSENARRSSKTNGSKRSSEAYSAGRRSGELSTTGYGSRQSSSTLKVVPLKNVEEGPATLPSDKNEDRDLNVEVKAALLAFILLICFCLTMFITHLSPASAGTFTAAREVNLTLVVPDAPVASLDDVGPSTSVAPAVQVHNRGM